MARLLSLSVLFAATACSSPPGEVWWIELGEDAPLDCQVDFVENYSNVDPPANPFTDPGFLLETTASPLGGHALLVRGDGDVVFLHIGGETFVGSETEGRIAVEWTASLDETQSIGAADYTFDAVDTRTSSETIVLQPEADGVRTGTATREEVVAVSVEESDEWDPAASGVMTSRIPGVNGPVLVPNRSDVDDCDGASCTLTFDSQCQQRLQVRALFAGRDDGSLFDALEGYGQDAGTSL